MEKLVLFTCLCLKIVVVMHGAVIVPGRPNTSRSSVQEEGGEELTVMGTWTTEPSAALQEDTMGNDQLDAKWVAPKYIQENFPYYLSGFDDEGRPIFVFEYGKYNYAAALAQGGVDMERNILKYWDQIIVNMRNITAQIAREGNGPDEYDLITDFDGFALSHVSSVAASGLSLKTLAKTGQFYEKLAYGYFINVNFMAEQLLNTARPFVGSLLERIEIYGTSKEVWLPRILRQLPGDQLPPWYGGSRQDFKPVKVFGR